MNKKILKNISLSKLTTFKIGGTAKYFVEVENNNQLIKAVKFAKENKLPIFVLGGGSDILISDDGFNGLVIRYIKSSISFEEKSNYVLVTASAGLNWDKLVEFCVKRKLQGIENLSGIPGSVGAAPVQNIGAYGQELKDSFLELGVYDINTEKFINMNKTDCLFGYRDSIFKNPKNYGKYIICDITLKLSRKTKPTIVYESLASYFKERGIKNPSIVEIRQAVLSIRSQKLDNPKIVGNAGSFFKNPFVSKNILREIQKDYPEVPYYEVSDGKIKLFAGWLIEKTGWKGKRYENARVSQKNALVIVNPEGKATARQVRNLANRIIKDVYRKFKIRLELEVQYIGFDKPIG